MDEGWPTAPGRPGWRPLDGFRAVGLHAWPGDTAARDAVRQAGLPWADAPGTLAGTDPVVAWRSPREWLLVGRTVEPLQRLLADLAPGRHDLAIAVDQTEALAVLDLHGPALDAWLARLADAAGLPSVPGHASRCRLADMPALLLRLADDRLWLVVDRPRLAHVRDWLAHAHEGAFGSGGTGSEGPAA